MTEDNKATLVAVFRCFVKPALGIILAVILFAFIDKTVLLLIPRYVGNTIDLALIKDRLALNRNILAIFLVFLTSSTLGAIRSYIDCLAHNRIDLSVKRSVFERIVSGMPRDNMRIGEMISIIEGDSSAVGQFYIGSLMNLIVNLMTCLISGYFAFSISPMLTLICFIHCVWRAHGPQSSYHERID